jgi:hypothetical protein
VSVKLSLVFLGLLPLLVVYLSLLLEVDILVQSIIIELHVLNFVLSIFLLIGQVKVVHNLDGQHDLLLAKDILDNHKCDIVLELLNGLLKLMLWDALGEDVDDKFVVPLIWLVLQLL